MDAPRGSAQGTRLAFGGLGVILVLAGVALLALACTEGILEAANRALYFDARLAEMTGSAIRTARGCISHWLFTSTALDAGRHLGAAEAAALTLLAARLATTAVGAAFARPATLDSLAPLCSV